MKAIVVNKVSNYNDQEALKLQEVTRPTLKDDEILVRNSFAGVNFIDTYQRNGLYPVNLPFILGREGSGIIEAVGGSVAGFNVGDRIAYLGTSTYAEYAIVSPKTTMKLPDNVSLEEGAAALLQGMTAAYLTHNSYPIQKNDFVLVPAAAGGTGSLICQLAHLRGAKVIGLTSSEAKAAIAKSNGADYVINYLKNDFVSEVQRITNGKGVKAVYDGVGKDLYRKNLECLSKQGFYIYFGNASGLIESVNPFDLSPKLIYFMRPALVHFIDTREDFLRCNHSQNFSPPPLTKRSFVVAGIVFDNIANQKLKIQIHKIYHLKDVSQAHHDLEGRHTTGKLLLKI